MILWQRQTFDKIIGFVLTMLNQNKVGASDQEENVERVLKNVEGKTILQQETMEDYFRQLEKIWETKDIVRTFV